MPTQINLDNVDIHFNFGNLQIQVEQLGYGVFSGDVPKHRHSKNFYEAHLITGGIGLLITDERSFSLTKGCLFMTGPGISHMQITDKQSRMSEYCLGFDIIPKKGAFDSVTRSLTENVFWFGKDTDDRCLSIFEDIESESHLRRTGYEYNVKSDIAKLFVELVRNYDGYALSEENQYMGADNKRLLMIDNIFMSRYATLTESEMCDMLHLSARQLQRILKKNYDKTFREMRQEARLNRAKELMESGASAEEAASQVGYNDINYFMSIIK